MNSFNVEGKLLVDLDVELDHLLDKQIRIEPWNKIWDQTQINVYHGIRFFESIRKDLWQRRNNE